MSQSQRQSELFAGNDWLAIYRAFTEVNLNAFDFSTIRSAMVDYVRRNYPEDFNDWIESSEFVALIDLMAYLGQSLAFRTDINARENFLETARRRESVLRLARSLSYNPKRNYAARGLVKLTELKSSYDVYDSTGRNLNNVVIKWDDPTNSNWFEQWILVLNASLIETNPFGVPLKTESLNGVETQLYRMDNIPTTAGNFPFSSNVNNRSFNFDIVNADFNTNFGFVEQTPNPDGAFHLIYRSDGNGNSSPDTGFFFYFKQGILQKSDYSITEPQENRTIFVDVANINETDVWVQTVNDQGSVVVDGDWTRVGYVPSDDITKILLTTENVTYNNINPEIQNIYQIVTQEQDKIVLRFGDGRFGQSPVGNLRVWYRVSANESINIRPDDIQNTQIIIPFNARNNTQKKLTCSFSLQESINNGTSAETNNEIRLRASRVYGTQGRMVSGSDYNELPVQTNLAVKLKSVNRVYSGQSRYIDLNDPTGSYQNTNVFSDDGAFYTIKDPKSVEVNVAEAVVDELMTTYIADLASGVSLRDFYANFLYEQLVENVVGIVNRFNPDYLLQTEIRRGVQERLELNRSFGLGFNNAANQGWYILDSSDINPDSTADYESNGPNSWLIRCEYNSEFWRFTARGLSYVFESEKDCRFFFVNEFKSIDPQTGKAGSDTINILRSPNNLRSIILLDGNNSQINIANDLVLKLEEPFTYSDGFVEPNRVKVRFYDRLGDGIPDIPFTYKALKNIDLLQNVIVHQLTYSLDGYPVERLIKRLELNTTALDDSVYANPTFVTQLLPGEYGYIERPNHSIDIYVGNEARLYPTIADRKAIALGVSETYQTVNNQQFMIREGVNNLVYQWKHFAPSNHRIDPAVSNIIDIFVLTREYNDAMTSWRNAGAILSELPKPPSELSLRNTFSQLEDYKMFSDEIIWRPVKFKILFGPTADASLQARFKVVRLYGTSMSDGEIKSKVIESIRNFFDVNNWEFGETFFFSELGAYIHRQLSTAISSVEIVPILEDSHFGNLREIRSRPDELFFTTAQVGDVEIITANTPTNLRIK